MLKCTTKVLLLDIEGTITSIKFVKDVLFLYVRENLIKVLCDNWGSEDFQSDITAIRDFSAKEIAGGVANLKQIPPVSSAKQDIIDAVYHNVSKWMDQDRKITVLKQLQGHIWRNAYADGSVKGHLYPDVVPVLREMVAKGVKVYIYSSGSIEAQKLLFSYSCEGNITELISGYFDTTTGSKTETESYRKICDVIGVTPSELLFLTDVEREAYPCIEAGCNCVLVVRPDNEKLSETAMEDFKIIENLNALC